MRPNRESRVHDALVHRSRVATPGRLQVGGMQTLSSLEDLPEADAGVIRIPDSTTYYLTNDIDLEGNQLEFLGHACIRGPCAFQSITSTGLNPLTPLLRKTAPGNLSLSNLRIGDVGTALDLQADCSGILLRNVFFENIAEIGLIHDAAYTQVRECNMTNCGPLRFEGQCFWIQVCDNAFFTFNNTGLRFEAGLVNTATSVRDNLFFLETGGASIHCDATPMAPNGYVLASNNFYYFPPVVSPVSGTTTALSPVSFWHDNANL